ncbi:MAG: glycosyltransferase family 2 protein [Labilithrix sp.]|nr:glycosyltransferase family 2 protein [Labilithrix sp.]MCW5810801.1 glycosyltransferase family 2 protein [Labilithrix sp.]
MAKTRCTVVVPFLNEARSLAALGPQLAKVLDGEDLEWEVILVDDGSTDESFEEARKLHDADARFKCLRFARNFGSHVAISAGLEHARGDVAIVTMADLEEPPESFPALLAMWREGHHLVWGIRKRRDLKGLNRLGSKLYHRVFGWLADMKPGQDEIGGGLFIADRRVLDAVRRFPERNRNIIGLLLWAGFKQGRLEYEPRTRKFGKSKWTFAKKVKLALDTFVGFSSRPLRALLLGGIAASGLGLAGVAVAIALAVIDPKLALAAAITGGVSALFLCIGTPLVATGLLGEYLWRALDEGRGRPLYVVMDRLGVDDAK